ncbi:MAG: KH domain-containing protein, partial [Erythrobacter sp.]|nr:KH domain-containing protein [Erythrobacter sp.]
MSAFGGYSGQAYSPSGDKGRFVLPPAFRKAVKESSGGNRILCLAAHDRFDCLIGFGLSRTDKLNQQLERESQEIMINAMERFANDCAYERTTSTIPLPNDEMKGRIIGREGRNIRTLETLTGVDVIIDDTPEAVVISCFDPIRK